MRFPVLIALICAPWVAQAHEVQSLRYAEIGGRVTVETTGDTTAETPFAIASVGKLYTATAILMLDASGALDVDDAAAEYLPEGIVEGYGGMQGITLRHLLTMTAGLPDFYTDDYIEDALDDPDAVQHAAVALTYAMDEEPLFAPGDAFDYSNTNYAMLGLVIETVTGKSYAQALEEMIFAPLGLGQSFVFGSRPLPEGFATGHEGRDHVRDYFEGNGFGDGGVITTAGELAAFYHALRDGVLLADPWLDMMMEDPVGEGYGMGIEMEGDIVGHSGGDLGFSSDVRMDITNGDIAIVLVGEADGDTDFAWDRLEDR
ncbi:MAG: serine hydrolase domain-containing protein [Pseudomonadota bacterium]|nr:serine hydrolase domain-containing protein [Pseudomonadota bacterium]